MKLNGNLLTGIDGSDKKDPQISVKKGFSSSRDESVAVRQLVRQIDQPDAAVVVLFASSDYNLGRLAEKLHEAFQTPLFGCTTAGEITPDGYIQGTLVGFSIASDRLQAYPFLLPNLRKFDSGWMKKTVKEIQDRLAKARKVMPEAREFGLLLIDGLSLMEEYIAAILANALEDVPIAGGSAGDDLKFKETFVYFDGKFHSDAALFTLFMTTLPFTLMKTQHFAATDERLVITAATPEKRMVQEINGRPAADEYARVIGMTLMEIKHLVYFARPLMLRVGGEYFVRSIQKVNEDSSLTFFSAIDEGLVLRVAKRENLLENLEHAFNQVRQKIPNIKLTIGCDCILRRLEIMDRALENPVNEILKRHNVIGFSTYGEQTNSLHVNQTFTGIVLGE